MCIIIKFSLYKNFLEEHFFVQKVTAGKKAKQNEGQATNLIFKDCCIFYNINCVQVNCVMCRV